uniref:Uncharacterized protein n=1 Tax=Manihot esculenta TaxID=3983 RepID=A0A251KE27_MANES
MIGTHTWTCRITLSIVTMGPLNFNSPQKECQECGTISIKFHKSDDASQRVNLKKKDDFQKISDFTK